MGARKKIVFERIQTFDFGLNLFIICAKQIQLVRFIFTLE